MLHVKLLNFRQIILYLIAICAITQIYFIGNSYASGVYPNCSPSGGYNVCRNELDGNYYCMCQNDDRFPGFGRTNWTCGFDASGCYAAPYSEAGYYSEGYYQGYYQGAYATPTPVRYSVTGKVWVDTNGDGLRDSEYTSSTNPARIQLEGLSGQNAPYTYTNLTSGSRELRLGTPNGYRRGIGEDGTRATTVGPSKTFNFLIEKDIYFVYAVVELDTNNDGTPDADYGSTANPARVNLELHGGFDNAHTWTNVVPGTYNLQLGLPAGYIDCIGEDGTRSVTVGPNKSYHFCIKKDVYNVEANVMLDSDGNGTRDSNYRDTTNPARVNLELHGGFDNYHFWTGVVPGTYDLNLGLPAGYGLGCGDSGGRTVVVGGDKSYDFCIVKTVAPTTPPTPIPGTYNTSGTIYIDTNNNNTLEPGVDPVYSGGASVVLKQGASTIQSTNSNSSGFYTFSNLANNTAYTNTLTAPSGYLVINTDGTASPSRALAYTVTGANVPNRNFLLRISPTPGVTTIATPTPTVTPTPAPLLYSISGSVFIDEDGDNSKDGAAENEYPGSSSITYKNQTTLATGSTTNSQFNFQNLPAGTYLITYNPPPPAGYGVYPSSLNFIVKIGPGCTPPFGTNDASCDLGDNIINLNFALTSAKAWIQTGGFDARFDGSRTNIIPQSNSCGLFAHIPLNNNSAGIWFNGSSDPDFGPYGKASDPAKGWNWRVGGPTYFDKYSLGALKSSYSSLDTTIKVSKKTIKTSLPASPTCTGNSCVIDSNFNGPYRITGPVTITSGGPLNPSRIAAGQQVVLLVNGDVHIAGNIDVAIGGYLLIVSSNDIYFDKNVGNTTPSCSTSSEAIEGIFVAEHNIHLSTVGANCTSGPDLQLAVQGSLITNASGTVGSLDNLRSLCAGNLQFPTLRVTERPDFIINSPDYITSRPTTWKEVAP